MRKMKRASRGKTFVAKGGGKKKKRRQRPYDGVGSRGTRGKDTTENCGRKRGGKYFSGVL